jgi:hypothetical protein
MSKHLEEIIERHFPDQPQVYPNRDKARSAMLEYAAWEASFLADHPLVEAGQGIAYWKLRASQAETRIRELEESWRSIASAGTAATAKSLDDLRFQLILFPWTKNLGINQKDATAGPGSSWPH